MESVDKYLKELASTRILVAGDIMLDQYWMGDVKRISPEAPVPIVAVSQTEERIGGAGNVAMNISALQGSCTLLGIVGGDDEGDRVKNIAVDSNIKSAIVEDSSIKTTIKLRVISKNQQLLRADFENNPNASVTNNLLDQYKELIEHHDAVVLSDYGKGGLVDVESMINIARESGKPVFVDPKGTDFSIYRSATMITPNLPELESVSGRIDDNEELAIKAEQLITQYDLGSLLVTLSEKGMTLFEAGQRPVHTPARSREVYDVSGAGDTVIAIMAMAWSAGLPNEIGLEFANSAAGVVISKLGTATTDKVELRAAVEQDY